MRFMPDFPFATALWQAAAPWFEFCGNIPMDMEGEYAIPAPRSRVWDALNDTETLRRCIPGCEELLRDDDTTLSAKLKLKIGPVSAKFAGRVTLSDIDAANGYRITGEGQGGAAGFGKGGAVVTLTDGPDGTTILRYKAEATVGGKLAQLGARLIQGTAAKLADEFFAAFAAALTPAD